MNLIQSQADKTASQRQTQALLNQTINKSQGEINRINELIQAGYRSGDRSQEPGLLQAIQDQSRQGAIAQSQLTGKPLVTGERDPNLPYWQ